MRFRESFLPRHVLATVVIFLGILAVGLLPWSGMAEEPSQPSGEGEIPRIYSAAPEDLTPRALEVRQRLELEKIELAKLNTTLAEATDPEARREVLQAINALKEATEIDLTRIQIKHAKLEGRTELAMELENALKLRLEQPTLKPAADRDPAERTH